MTFWVRLAKVSDIQAQGAPGMSKTISSILSVRMSVVFEDPRPSSAYRFLGETSAAIWAILFMYWTSATSWALPSVLICLL